VQLDVGRVVACTWHWLFAKYRELVVAGVGSVC